MVSVLNMASSTVLLLEQLPTLLSRRHPQLSHSNHFKIKPDTSIESQVQIKFINVGHFTGDLLAVKISCFICTTFFQYSSTVIIAANKCKNPKSELFYWSISKYQEFIKYSEEKITYICSSKAYSKRACLSL